MPISLRRLQRLTTLAILLGATASAFAAPDGSDAWQVLDALPAARASSGDALIRPRRFQPLMADNKRLRTVLAAAPMEFTPAAATPLVLAIPAPDGTIVHFEVVESPVMEPAMAAQFPEIKTYAGVGIEDPHAQVRLDITPLGFRAQVLTPDGDWYIDPYTKGDTELLTSYRRADLAPPTQAFRCGFHGTPVAARGASAARSARAGETLTTYRLAIAATGEYTRYFGGTVTLGLAAIVSAVNRVTGVYERDLAVRLVLINNSSLIFTNSSTDPYTNDDGEAMLDQNQARIDSVIGSANYDVGHVFSTGGGGIAALGVICDADYKAQGVTGSDQPDGDAFWIDYVAHELGHQFGAEHTFNSETDACGGGNRSGATAMEPGSGSTIMAYAGICGSDDLQPHTDAYFHSVSYDQIVSYLGSEIGASCGTETATGNRPPTVNGGADYNIPRSTPFVLTATGSDPDGDALTYCWEERDLGVAQTITEADNGSSPLFRSLSPKTSPQRYFPALATVIANGTNNQEKLPTRTRDLKFRVMVRDNRLLGGGVAWDDVLVKVSSGAGPFLVTFPNASATLSGQQTITWNVANTTATPVSCANVNILLSTDGGLTFPTTLASNVPNDGSQPVTLPNIATATARIMVQGAGNVFYDMSNANFTIQPAFRDNWSVR